MQVCEYLSALKGDIFIFLLTLLISREIIDELSQRVYREFTVLSGRVSACKIIPFGGNLHWF